MSMNSNPHFSTAAKSNAQLVSEETANEHYVAEHGLTDETMQFSALNRIAEVTLALAYEQRTANLIAERNDCIHSYYKGNLSGDGILRLKHLTDQIDARLGLK